MKRVIFLTIISGLLGVIQPANAETKPYCYMESQEGKVLDLRALCGEVYTQTSYSGSTGAYGSYGSGASAGSSSTGNCQYSWQVDSAGRLCGQRAVNASPVYSPSYSGSSGYSSGYSGASGRTWVSPYTRSDGTSVRGHYRSR